MRERVRASQARRGPAVRPWALCRYYRLTPSISYLLLEEKLRASDFCQLSFWFASPRRKSELLTPYRVRLVQSGDTTRGKL
jgi:hypothetical protein